MFQCLVAAVVKVLVVFKGSREFSVSLLIFLFMDVLFIVPVAVSPALISLRGFPGCQLED